MNNDDVREIDEDDILVHQLVKTKTAPPPLKKRKPGVSINVEEKKTELKMKFKFVHASDTEQEKMSSNESSQGIKAAFKPPGPVKHIEIPEPLEAVINRILSGFAVDRINSQVTELKF